MAGGGRVKSNSNQVITYSFCTMLTITRIALSRLFNVELIVRGNTGCKIHRL